jgi:hypothetical protein
LCARFRCGALKHDPEKWISVFGTDHAQTTLPLYAVIGKRAGCRGITGCDPVERSEIRERRCSNAVLADAQLFEAVDGDNIKFRVFLANLECGLKFRRIAPAFQRLHDQRRITTGP